MINIGYFLYSAHFGAANDSVPIWLDDVECVGTERSIVNCFHGNWTVHDCHHNEDAGVACTSESILLCVCVCVCVCVSVCLCLCLHLSVCLSVSVLCHFNHDVIVVTRLYSG